MLNEIRQKCHAYSLRLKLQINKNYKTGVLVYTFLFLIFFAWIVFALTSFYHASQFQVIYSLDQKSNNKEIINLIDNAHKYIYFAIYYFTKDDIANALIRAQKRGVKVWGITDREASLASNKNIIEKLRKADVNIEVRKNDEGIMHMKAIVTDKAYASGSYNWTGSATLSNDEILEIGSNKSVRKQYLQIIQRLLENNSKLIGSSGENKSSGIANNLSDKQNKSGQLLEYDYKEAGQHVGEEVKVLGKVLKIYTAKSGVTFFDFCTKYKDCPFSAVIFASDLAKFGDLKQYQREVKISGTIKSYNGKAEIILNDKEQIE
jgi:hypothetical protein